MTPQNVRDSPSAEGLTASVHKELRRSDRSTDGQPSAECRSRCFPKRQCALAAALATHADTRRLGPDFVETQASQFGDSKPSTNRKMEHGSISHALPRRWIRRVKQGLHFLLTRYPTSRVSVFLNGIARTRRTCSTAAGSRCCRKRKNERRAAKRMFLVSAELPRALSRCSRNVLIIVASNCSSSSAEGATLSFWEANSNKD